MNQSSTVSANPEREGNLPEVQVQMVNGEWSMVNARWVFLYVARVCVGKK